VGGSNVVDYARGMGIKQPLHAGPSLAIGACEVTPMEITSSYGIFANRGVHAEPYIVEKIVDKNGRVLEKASPKTRAAISPQDAFLMSDMMTSVVCCGTGASIRGLGFTRRAGGKTGTTNDYSDAWFIGFTPQIVCGVWTGVDERRSMGRGVTGSMAAVPVWVSAMQALHKDLPSRDFGRPDGIKALSVCAQSGGLAGNACPKTRVEYFKTGTAVDACDAHGIARGLRDGSDMDIFGPSKRGGGGGGTGGSGGSSSGSGSGGDRAKKRMMF
jgi:penicillin-binding protein 1A